MLERFDINIYKFRLLIIGSSLLALSFFIIWFIGATVSAAHSQSQQSIPYDDWVTIDSSDTPNVVTDGANHAIYTFEQSMHNAGRATSTGMRTVTSSTAHSSKLVVNGITHSVASVAKGTLHITTTAAKVVGNGFVWAGKTVGSGILFVLRVPIGALGFIAHATPVSAIIRPSDHNPVPVIDPKSPALVAAKKALPATSAPNPASPAAAPAVVWPIHGAITTLFGVPEPPYQAIHTGIDISDGQRPGVTPVKAYRHGTVIQVSSVGGLGNHVVVDHGSGVTSVYGHLNSFAVSVGQEVDTTTTLGYEGTTGVSTGTHLHFEIRVDGQATDPQQFITGQP